MSLVGTFRKCRNAQLKSGMKRTSVDRSEFMGFNPWQQRVGRIAVWETAFNVARADQAGGEAEMLG